MPNVVIDPAISLLPNKRLSIRGYWFCILYDGIFQIITHNAEANGWIIKKHCLRIPQDVKNLWKVRIEKAKELSYLNFKSLYGKKDKKIGFTKLEIKIAKAGINITGKSLQSTSTSTNKGAFM